MQEKIYTVYILCSQNQSTLYVGMTSDLPGRLYEHEHKVNPNAFTAKYNIHKLVHYEEFADAEKASYREFRLKKWERQWKENLINKHNPEWEDLAPHVRRAYGEMRSPTKSGNHFTQTEEVKS